jgi:hypothetical protein
VGERPPLVVLGSGALAMPKSSTLTVPSSTSRWK